MFLADKKEVEGTERGLKFKPEKVKNAAGGRPKKDEIKLKSKRLTLRFTVAEWDLLSKQSKVSNLSKADFLRQCSVQSKPYLPMRQSLPVNVIDLLKDLEMLSGTMLKLSHQLSQGKIISDEVKQTAL